MMMIFLKHHFLHDQLHQLLQVVHQNGYAIILEKELKYNPTIDQYVGRKLFPHEINTFYRLLLRYLRMTISNGWAFQ